MRFIFVTAMLLLFANTFAYQDAVLGDQCGEYESVPDVVVRNLPRVSTRDWDHRLTANNSSIIQNIKLDLENAFTFTVSQFSERVSVNVFFVGADQNTIYFDLSEQDNQMSAWGGSEYKVTVQISGGSVAVELMDCWASGE